MDVFVDQINSKEKKYVCEDCYEEYAKDNVKYIFTLEHHSITKVEEKKSGSREPEKPGPVKPEWVQPEPVKPEPVKPQTRQKKTVIVIIENGDSYSKLQQMADAICGKGKISVDDWNPGIYSTYNLRPGTYTCDCPK